MLWSPPWRNLSLSPSSHNNDMKAWKDSLSWPCYKASPQHQWLNAFQKFLNWTKIRPWKIPREEKKKKKMEWHSQVYVEADVIDNTCFVMPMFLVFQKLPPCSKNGICTSKCFYFRRKTWIMEYEWKCRKGQYIMKMEYLGIVCFVSTLQICYIWTSFIKSY